MRDGAEVLVYFDPSRSDFAHVCSLDGRPLGEVKRLGKVDITDQPAVTDAEKQLSVSLILALAGKEGAEKYLRTVQVLNKEALTEVSDAELAKYGITRKAKENFSVSTEVVNLGKAVKAAERSEKAAAKAAKKAAETAGGKAS
jgi:hypothetical protein